MATLAIKGHVTRGKEVIEILEMLGGKNEFDVEGCTHNPYSIDSEGVIVMNRTICDCGFNIFTLEKFLEKYPYKIGDKVKIIDYEYSLEVVGLRWNNDAVEYEVYTTDYGYWFKVEELQPYKEQEPMEEQKLIPPYMDYDVRTSKEETIKIDIPKGYEFAGIDDDNQQVVFEKVKPQYPKTYEECCDILQLEHIFELKDLTMDEEKLIDSFIRLKRCRDAYWKLAGDELGLGKPWEPDFTDDSQERYGIYTARNNITLEFYGGGDVNLILTFPTEEMRDAFYENFKDLIEQCKELL